MTARVDDLEKRLQSFDSFVRLELGKLLDRLDKLETQLDAQKKLIKKIAESLKNGAGTGNSSSPAIGGDDDGASKEELDKLR